MNPKPITATYFDQYNQDLDAGGRGKWMNIYRQIGDGDIVLWTRTPDGAVYKTTNTADMPLYMQFCDEIDAARRLATATGQTSGVRMYMLGDERNIAEWHAADPAPAADAPQAVPFDARTVETPFLLGPPSHYGKFLVVAHAFIPPLPRALPAHLVVYYTGPDPAYWAPDVIGGTETMFGVGRIEYDDDGQTDRHVDLLNDVTLMQAMSAHTAALTDALGDTLA